MSKFIKTIVRDLEARDKMLKGMNILADAVGSTLGPRSRNVALDQAPDHDIPPTVLHDGVSVARGINLKDVHEDMGVRLLKSASLKTDEVAGDGTTGSTVIAQALVNEAFKNITAGENPMLLKQQIEEATKLVIEELKKLSKPIKTDEEIEQVATISAGDPVIGKLVSEAIKKVGKDGVISIENGSKIETTVDYKTGMEIDRGYATTSPYFQTNGETTEAIIEDPYILMTDRKLNFARDLSPFLERFIKETKSKNLVIFAGEVIEEALQFLVVNKLRGHLNVLAVQAPAFGDRRIDELSDIAILTGGTAILEDAGRQVESVDITELGRADKIIADRDKTTIIGGKGDKDVIKGRINDLRDQIKVANTPYDADIKEERLAKLAGSVAVINVGGLTETEVKEKRERVIDAKKATQAAIEEGIVAGGEITLLNMATKLEYQLVSNNLGEKILIEALKAPFKRLMTNSGFDYADIREKMSGHVYPEGIDVTDGQIKDMIKSGIIDPTKVARSAIENAVSVATLAMTTNTLITDIIRDK
jgi:chaperonin GroEL